MLTPLTKPSKVPQTAREVTDRCATTKDAVGKGHRSSSPTPQGTRRAAFSVYTSSETDLKRACKNKALYNTSLHKSSLLLNETSEGESQYRWVQKIPLFQNHS